MYYICIIHKHINMYKIRIKSASIRNSFTEGERADMRRENQTGLKC